MAHAGTHPYALDPDEALQAIKAERTRRSWIAVILFILSGAAIVVSFYFSYRELPAPASPANNSTTITDPYH
jgi:hypothetical protein